MLETALYAGMGCAVCAALAGSRTAWILLGSVFACLLFDRLGVPFNPNLWLLFDFAVIILVVRPEMTRWDAAILALFVPGWAFYLLPDDYRYAGSMLVTTAQLILTAPGMPMWAVLRRFWARVKVSAQHVEQYIRWAWRAYLH